MSEPISTGQIHPDEAIVIVRCEPRHERDRMACRAASAVLGSLFAHVTGVTPLPAGDGLAIDARDWTARDIERAMIGIEACLALVDPASPVSPMLTDARGRLDALGDRLLAVIAAHAENVEDAARAAITRASSPGTTH